MKSRYWVNINDLYWTRHGGANLYPLQWIWQGKRTWPRSYTKIILEMKQNKFCDWLFQIQSTFSWPNFLPKRDTQKACMRTCGATTELTGAFPETVLPAVISLHPESSHSLQQRTMRSLDWTTMVALFFCSAGRDHRNPKCSQAALDSTGLEMNPFTLHPQLHSPRKPSQRLSTVPQHKGHFQVHSKQRKVTSPSIRVIQSWAHW